MNTYQKIAFGAFGLVALALLVAATYDLNGLKVAVVFMLVVALLTLKTIRKFLLTVVQSIGLIIGGVGHLVGIIGDELADWSKDRKVRLVGSSPVAPQPSNVPDWDSPRLARVDGHTTDDSDEHKSPSFLDRTLQHQNV